MEFEELRRRSAIELCFGMMDLVSYIRPVQTRETEVRLKCTSRQVDMRYTLERRFNIFSGMTAHREKWFLYGNPKVSKWLSGA